VEYADRLRTLLRPDLEHLLTNRPEASALAGRRSAGYDDLAGLLALPHGIARAVASLDRYHRQVLELACVAGGSLEPQFAEEQGLEPGLLPAAAGELARWALAFPEAEGLWVPAAVLGAMDDAGRVGVRLAPLLQELTVASLRAIADTLGVGAPGARKAELAALVVRHLRDASRVRELVAGAPETASLVLQALRSAGGRQHWYELAHDVPGIYAERGGIWGVPVRPADDGIGWLRARALVVCIDWSRQLLVPAEVELALRGRLFASWEPEPPALEFAPLEPDRHPAELVIEVGGLLDLWREPVTLLQSGGLGARECSRAAA